MLQERLALRPRLFCSRGVFWQQRALFHHLLRRLERPLSSLCREHAQSWVALAAAHKVVDKHGASDVLRTITDDRVAELSVGLAMVSLWKDGEHMGEAPLACLCRAVDADAATVHALGGPWQSFCCVAEFSGPLDDVEDRPTVLCHSGLYCRMLGCLLA